DGSSASSDTRARGGTVMSPDGPRARCGNTWSRQSRRSDAREGHGPWGPTWARESEALGEAGPVDRRKTAADGDSAARVAREGGHHVGVTLVKAAVAEWKQRRREVPADVSA